jgi:hypothetical protein
VSGLRYYSTPTGRWASRDPIEEDGGLNLYNFAVNASANHIDYIGDAARCYCEYYGVDVGGIIIGQDCGRGNVGKWSYLDSTTICEYTWLGIGTAVCDARCTQKKCKYRVHYQCILWRPSKYRWKIMDHEVVQDCR